MTRDELRKRVMSKIMDYAEAYEAIPKADPDPAEYADAILALFDQAKGVPVEPSDDVVERAASAIREHVEPSHPDTIDIIIGVDDAAKAVLAALKPGDRVGDGCVVVKDKMLLTLMSLARDQIEADPKIDALIMTNLGDLYED